MDMPAGPGVAPSEVAPEPRLSEVISSLAGTEAPRLSVRDIVDALGERSFAPVMILLAAPNALPFIPGSSTVLGLLLALLGLQLVLGRRRVWLPERLNRWSFDRDGFARLVARIAPWLARFESMARPRLWHAPYRLSERLAGAAALGLSLMIMLPIPFANGMPAVAICLLALGVSERDGLWLAAGLLVGCIAAGIVAGLFLAGFAAATTFM